MNIAIKNFIVAVAILSALSASYVAISGFSESALRHYKVTRIFPEDSTASVTFDESIIASPLLDISQNLPFIIVPVSNGIVAALDSETGALVWQVNMPALKGQQAQIVSTPVIIGSKLVILYQCLEKNIRVSHRLAVIDLDQRQLDKSFPVLDVSAEKPSADGLSSIKFNPPTAFSHSALKHVIRPDAKWGSLYLAFGNAGDTQPYHGWLFEVDMDSWQQQGTAHAIRNVLLTTPEAKCPVTMAYGNQEMICGGGIWTPAGPQVYPTADSFELIVPTGNGQIDLARGDYANTLMRVQPNLQFDPGCDAQLCQNFYPKNPSTACIASCKNLFIPRLSEWNMPLKPATGECDRKTFWECLAWMDYDLGASAPVKATLKSGHSVLVQPGKEGAVYLIDAGHLGTQYDRLEIVDVCGTPTDVCKASWMGMIVTQPVLSTAGIDPVVVIPTFVPDTTHPAGLVALSIVEENGKPKFKRLWQFPNPASEKAVQSFRSHPSLPVISTIDNKGDEIVWVVDIGTSGTLYGIRVKDGALLVEQSLLGAGRPLSAPIVYGNTVYLASIMPNTGKAMIEAYRIEVPE
ncbi:hypothetical protein [Crenothrix polyspora]|uniref:Pyrrolo-quinoline quinone n=1 Tax=Crenothrix polyspora TaxID=360316 RepID=A0A1R4HEF1_9GAMM|nr:hypothetical protein [Crenothrix polyspora]SJM94587.1 conserved hypothetical protein [Crenothrix polyspora]